MLILLNLEVIVLAVGVDAINQKWLGDYYPKITLLSLGLCLVVLAMYIDLEEMVGPVTLCLCLFIRNLEIVASQLRHWHLGFESYKPQ